MGEVAADDGGNAANAGFAQLAIRFFQRRHGAARRCVAPVQEGVDMDGPGALFARPCGRPPAGGPRGCERRRGEQADDMNSTVAFHRLGQRAADGRVFGQGAVFRVVVIRVRLW